ncbi:MAG: hypothetical protein RJB11_3377, partial [Planctomycetota bacterium]
MWGFKTLKVRRMPVSIASQIDKVPMDDRYLR